MSNASAVPPIESQEVFWNRWNTDAREEKPLDRDSARRGAWAEASVRRLGRISPRIIDIGWGTGWLSARLTDCGPVVATDLAGEVIERARANYPEVTFLAGDFVELDLEPGSFEVAVCLETLSHVADQKAFIRGIARALAPGGHLILTTQNRTVMNRLRVPPPGPGQIRNWVAMGQLKKLLQPEFDIVQASAINAPGYGRLSLRRWVPAGGICAMAERAGLGKTLVMVARKAG